MNAPPSPRAGRSEIDVWKVRRVGRFRDLPLFWKFIIPFVAIMLVAGTLGAFFIVRELSSRAERDLDEDLTALSLEVRSRLKDQELYLLESVNLAANLRGMSGALARQDRVGATRLLQSVLALKTDLDFLGARNATGSLAVGFTWDGRRPSALSGRSRTLATRKGILSRALAEDASKSAGFVKINGDVVVAIVAPVCSESKTCHPAGTVVAGIRADELLLAAATSPQGDPRAPVNAALYDGNGRAVATLGRALKAKPPSIGSDENVRLIRTGDQEIATLYSPFRLRDEVVGTLALSIPTAPAFSSAQDAAVRLGLILLGVMAGLLVLGLLLSRSFLAQVAPLLETNRALGAGELAARAPVLSNDELGELARGVNKMAEQLQASYETLELRVDERTREIRRLLSQRTEFFASLSHEFRTPLAVILQQIDMLLDPSFSRINGAAGESQKAIRDSAMQLLAVVNDILDLARVETGGLEIDLAPVAVPDVVGELRHMIEGLSAAGGLRAAIDCPADLPLVNADSVRLKEIIVNLIDNAVKYTPPGGKIELAARVRDGLVEISISDSGVGIPEDVGLLIFEPFYQVKGIEPQGGQRSSGLGLALAKRLVEAQGGEISFASEVNVGTTFKFTLQQAQASVAPNALSVAVEPVSEAV